MSPASRMIGSSPWAFRLLIWVDFLGRPPLGLFFHPQGSIWLWTFPVTTRTADPDFAFVLEHDVSATSQRVKNAAAAILKDLNMFNIISPF